MRKDGWIEADLVSHDLRHRAHRLGAGGNHDVRLAQADSCCCVRDRLQARRTETIDRDTRNARWQPRQQTPDPGDVHALLGFRHRTAHDDIANFRRIQRWHLPEHALQHMCQQIVRAGVAKHATLLAYRGPHSRNDIGVLNGFVHVHLPNQLRKGLPVSSMCWIRAWVSGCLSSSTNRARSTSRIQCSGTFAWVSTSPPHNAVAAARATV